MYLESIQTSGDTGLIVFVLLFSMLHWRSEFAFPVSALLAVVVMLRCNNGYHRGKLAGIKEAQEQWQKDSGELLTKVETKLKSVIGAMPPPTFKS